MANKSVKSLIHRLKFNLVNTIKKCFKRSVKFKQERIEIIYKQHILKLNCKIWSFVLYIFLNSKTTNLELVIILQYKISEASSSSNFNKKMEAKAGKIQPNADGFG